MNDYQRRKQERREAYLLNHGRKLIRCIACNGSGYYDNHGSPRCGSCNGTGKERDTSVRHPSEEFPFKNTPPS